MSLIKFLYFFLPLACTLSYAQGFITKSDSINVYKLTDVVVTATKTRTSTLELANSISIIDSVHIANSSKSTVFELLSSEYGINTLQFGPGGSLSTINIRGADAGHSLILVDGIEMNLTSESSNLYDFANLSVNGIDRIEVLRGPQSTLYGSDAMAGVVNVITKKGNGSPALYFSGEGGSYNTYKGALGFSGNYMGLNYNISLSRTQTDGFSAAGEKYGNAEPDGYKGNNFSSRIGYNINDDSGLDLFFHFTKAETELDQDGGPFKDDPTYIYNLEETGILSRGFLNLFDGHWEIKMSGSYIRNVRKYNYDSTLYNPVTSNSSYDGRKYKLDLQNNFNIGPNNILTFGAETEKEEASTYFYSLSSFGPYESILPKSEIYTSGIYMQHQLNFDKEFFATAGIRYDYHNKFGDAFTFRVAPAYIFWDSGTKVKATLGTSFKAPSIFYLYDEFFGNEDLKPEKSLGLDLGIEQFFFTDQVTLGLTYFNNDYTDLIGLDQNFQAYNIDEVNTSGIEFFVSTNPSDNVYLKATYTYTDAKDKSKSSQDYNRQLLRRPEVKITFQLNYSLNEKTNINLEIIHSGKREDKNFSQFPAVRTTLGSFTLVNISAHHDLFDYLRLYIKGENLFDEQYEEVYGFGTAGLSVYGGFKIKIL